jgi:hypothetical protein
MFTTDESWDDDEDWVDDEQDDVDEPPWPCPECGAAVPSLSEMCLECGHWLTEADSRAIKLGRGRLEGLKLAAMVLLVALLAFALVGGFMMF